MFYFIDACFNKHKKVIRNVMIYFYFAFCVFTCWNRRAGNFISRSVAVILALQHAFVLFPTIPSRNS